MGETQWHGDNPYCLVVSERGGGVTLIDLDEPDWMKTHADLMRGESQWILARKQGSEPVFTVLVAEGEQPYYTARVFGVLNLPPGDWFSQQGIEVDLTALKEHVTVRAYGIGKKRLDNHVDRLWILPNGVVCSGDDVETLGHDLAKNNLARIVQKLRETHGSDRREDASRGQEGGDNEGQAGQEQGHRPPGSGVRFPARPKVAHRRTQQRPPSGAVASARRPRGSGEAGGRGDGH